MGPAAEWRRPVAVDQQAGGGRVGHVVDGQATVAPGAVGQPAADDGVVERVAALGRPGGRLAAVQVHPRQPPGAGQGRPGRVGHVDGDEDEVAEPAQQRRGVRPAAAHVPDPVQPEAVHRQEADLAGPGRVGQVVHLHAGPVGGRRVGGQHLADRAAVVGRLVGEGLGREQVDGVDDQQQPVGELQVQVPGAGRGRQVADRPGSGVADVQDGHAVAEHVADIGVAVADHDLDAVATAALVGVAEQGDVAGEVGCGRHPDRVSGPRRRRRPPRRT